MLKRVETLLFFAAVVAALTLAALPALQELHAHRFVAQAVTPALVQLERVVITPQRLPSPEQAASFL